MCRLFGMHAGGDAVPATFWLVDASDSLSAQSHRNPDGAGIGAFDAGVPIVDKQPLAAWQDPEFAAAAHTLMGTTFVAHVRHASSGALTTANTHPFLQDGRLFAHNGVVQGLALLDARLAELGVDDLVQGQTDSERVFALITAETRRCGGDVADGLLAAISWIGRHLPVYSINLVLATATDLWALRYPATNELYVLARPAGRTGTGGRLDLRGSRLRASADDLATRPAVVVASEKMNNDRDWRPLDPGELLHIASNLTVTSSTVLPDGPDHVLTLQDLDPPAASSQAAGGV